MEALVVSLFDPSARDNGFALRVSSMIEALKPHSNVTVLTFSDSAKDGELVDGVGYNFVKRPRYTFRQRLIDTALLRSGLISRTYSPEFKSLFSRTLDQLRPDLIVYESVFMAQYAPSVTTARQWLDEHNIEWRVLEAFAHQDLRVGVKGLIPYIYHRLEAWKLKAIEKSIAGSMDRIFCVNADEANVIASVAKKSPVVLPNVVNLPKVKTRQSGASNTVLFVGTLSYLPNIAGIAHFIANIWPQILQDNPKAQLRVIGKGLPASYSYLKHTPSVCFLGWIDKLNKEYEEAGVVIAPIYAGGGSQFKIIEAMAHAKPVVAAEFSAKHLKGSIESDAIKSVRTDAEFINAVKTLLDDSEKGQSLGDKARSFIAENLSQSRVNEIVGRVINE